MPKKSKGNQGFNQLSESTASTNRICNSGNKEWRGIEQEGGQYKNNFNTRLKQLFKTGRPMVAPRRIDTDGTVLLHSPLSNTYQPDAISWVLAGFYPS
jgi:hypothetical protein